MFSTKIQINPWILFYAFLGVLLIDLVFRLQTVLLIFFVAFIINCGLRPIVSWLEDKLKFKRSVAITIVYLTGIVLAILILTFIFGETYRQILLFFTDIDSKIFQLLNFLQNNFPFLVDLLNIDNISKLDVKSFIDNTPILVQILSTFGSQGLRFVFNAFEFILFFLLIIILSIYMIKPKEGFYTSFVGMLPSKISRITQNLLPKIEYNLGSWLISLFVLMFFIGFFTYLIILLPGFFDTTYILGKYALLIALISGLLEAVPNIGPTITLIITLIIAITSGGSIPILIYIIIMFMLLQQIEALFLVPIIMKKAVNLHPVVSILGVLGGFSVAGVLGALLSMPVLSVFQIVFVEILKYYKDLENKNLHTYNINKNHSS